MADIMTKIEQLMKNPKIWMLIIFLILSIIAIKPHFVVGEDGDIYTATAIKKGLDLEGGVRALLLPEDTGEDILSRTRTTLQTRVNAMGLTETKIQIVAGRYVQVEMAGKTETELKDMLEQQGMFESKIKRHIDIKNNTAKLKINGNEYDISIIDNRMILNNKTVAINERSTIEDITYTLANMTETQIILNFDIFTGEDVKTILRDAHHTNVGQYGQSWKFQFGIIISPEAAKRLAKVTKDIPIDINTGYLKENIDLYLDKMLVNSLSVAAGLRGQASTDIIISGPGESKQDATTKMLNLQAILESGALPTPVKVIKIETISPTLGEQFAESATIAVIFSIVVVSIIIFIRYRDPIIVVPIIITAFSEVIIILGFAAASKWTIDLAAIAGIIAAVGTGVDDQIIITDESKFTKVIMSLEQKMKNAFFIIFTAFFTTVAAMVPLLFIGAGGIKGFALTTIIGVTIGVLITRPAYAKFIEIIKE